MTVHLDATALGMAPVPYAELLRALDAAHRQRQPRPPWSELPYATWRERVRATGGAAEAALAVLPAPSLGDQGDVLRLPSPLTTPRSGARWRSSSCPASPRRVRVERGRVASSRVASEPEVSR